MSELLLSDEQLQSSFNRAQGHAVGMAVVSPEGRWLKVNAYLCEMLGYEEEELLGMTFQELTHPEDLAIEQPYLLKLTAGAIDHYQLKKRYFHKAGHLVWGVLNRSVRRDEAGGLLCFVSHIRDVTAEKNAERPPSFFRKVGGKLRGLFRRQ
ncbi:MAG TPA: PAS domain S-box protein [Chthoniobacteraceae bacterium]|jgi:PAS domain S-box-containing protein|nr:PAS domain S-box protein [Chthoniobacteraceae bacterium]